MSIFFALFIFVIISAFLYRLLVITNRLFFDPLRKFPGPRLYAASRLPLLYRRSFVGTWPHTLKTLHARYGDVVRVAPSELSFAHADAWPEIYGIKKGAAPGAPRECGKDVLEYASVDPGVKNAHILTCSFEDHARQRRLLGHPFSERALRGQGPLVEQYVDLLMQRLQERVGQAVDLVVWFNYTTFDIIGQLAFAEPFGCLREQEYHEWIAVLYGSFRTGIKLSAINSYPIGKAIVRYLMPDSFVKKRVRHKQLAMSKIRKRMAAGVTGDQDIMSHLIEHNDDKGMTTEEMEQATAFILVAGSETTATALAALTYLVCSKQEAYDRLVEEIRTTYISEGQITLANSKSTPYLQGCIEEALRLYPPVPTTLHRVVPLGGDIINGHFVQEGTYVGAPPYTMFRSPKYFAEPDHFHPERWLPTPDARFANDNKAVLQPFSYGPRNCVGKSLAYAEMRLIFSRLLWKFDLELQPEGRRWIERSKPFSLWNKPALPVVMRPVRR